MQYNEPLRMISLVPSNKLETRLRCARRFRQVSKYPEDYITFPGARVASSFDNLVLAVDYKALMLFNICLFSTFC